MDEKIFHLINEQSTNPAFDLFMTLISYAAIWTPFFLIAAVALLIFGGFRGRAFVFCTALTLGLSNAAVDPLKHAIGRPRPKQVQTVRMIELEKTRPITLTIWKKRTSVFQPQPNAPAPALPFHRAIPITTPRSRFAARFFIGAGENSIGSSLRPWPIRESISARIGQATSSLLFFSPPGKHCSFSAFANWS